MPFKKAAIPFLSESDQITFVTNEKKNLTQASVWQLSFNKKAVLNQIFSKILYPFASQAMAKESSVRFKIIGDSLQNSSKSLKKKRLFTHTSYLRKSTPDTSLEPQGVAYRYFVTFGNINSVRLFFKSSPRLLALHEISHCIRLLGHLKGPKESRDVTLVERWSKSKEYATVKSPNSKKSPYATLWGSKEISPSPSWVLHVSQKNVTGDWVDFFFEKKQIFFRSLQTNQCDRSILETLSYAWNGEIIERGNFRKTVSYLMTCVKPSVSETYLKKRMDLFALARDVNNTAALGKEESEELMNKQFEYEISTPCYLAERREDFTKKSFAIQSDELIKPIRSYALLNPVQRQISKLLDLMNTFRKQGQVKHYTGYTRQQGTVQSVFSKAKTNDEFDFFQRTTFNKSPSPEKSSNETNWQSPLIVFDHISRSIGSSVERVQSNSLITNCAPKGKRYVKSIRNVSYVYPGQLVAYGENIAQNIATTESGQILYVDSQRATFRKAQTVLIYSQAVIAVLSGEWIKKGAPLMALSYQKLVTGDIVQGLPKIEQFFEAPLLKDGTFWSDSLQAKLNQFFQEYREKFPLAEAVRKGFSDIQRVLVEGVQRVYISQGVLIADKHLEVIVRQMTCKGRILYSGDTGFLRNELVSLDKIESVNQVTYGQKALYHPQVRGITDASLESESFLSAASFQETTRVLSRDAVIGKTDLMRGLKERVIVGELIQAGTGLANNSVYTFLLS